MTTPRARRPPTAIEQLRAVLADLTRGRDAGQLAAGEAAHHVAMAVAVLVAAEPVPEPPSEDIAHGAPYAEHP